jgi:hypothetical protein
MAFIWLHAPSVSQKPSAADVAYADTVAKRGKRNLSEIHIVLNISLNIMNILNNTQLLPQVSLIPKEI